MRRSDFYGEGLFIAFVFKAYIFPPVQPGAVQGVFAEYQSSDDAAAFTAFICGWNIDNPAGGVNV